MTNPCQSHLAGLDFGEFGAADPACTFGDPSFPEEFVKEGSRMKMVARREFFKGKGQATLFAKDRSGVWAGTGFHPWSNARGLSLLRIQHG